MIKVLQKGIYSLIETKQQIKILYLDGKPLVWLFVPGIGHVLEITNKPHSADHVLAQGNYRIYEVKGEAEFVNQQHLELFVGEEYWQSYLLLTGLPSAKHRRVRIIATTEAISLRKPQYSY